MIDNQDANLNMVIEVARHLDDLRDKVVFVGGCVTGLFITDPAVPGIRATKDVDVIVEISSRREYYVLEEELRKHGFEADMSDNAPVCRWVIDDIKVDIMPTEERILGFSNRWYLQAIRTAQSIELEKGLSILLVTPPYFLTTKIEAFAGRGRGDYLASHDMEDIITVVDGRPEIVSEVRQSSEELQEFFSETFRELLANSEFIEALPGHLLPDRASQDRLPLIMERLRQVAGSRTPA